jgi:hypothetical protein
MPASYGRLGKPIMRYLRTLSDVVSAHPLGVTRGSFLASANRELSVALVQSQGYVYCMRAMLLAKASGWQMLPRADIPFVDRVFYRPRVSILLAVSNSISSILVLF